MRAISLRASLLAPLVAAVLLGAAPQARAEGMGVTLTGGTLGFGLGVGFGVSDRWNARVGFNKYDMSDDFSSDGVDYEADLDLESVHALADWHPFGGGLRVTGGVVLNNNSLSGSATIDGDETIGGTSVPNNASGRLGATIDFDDASPYLGIGWGNQISGWGPIGFSADLGVLFQGSPRVELREEQDITGINQDDLDREARDVEDELEDFDLYPVLSVGLIYRF